MAVEVAKCARQIKALPMFGSRQLC